MPFQNDLSRRAFLGRLAAASAGAAFGILTPRLGARAHASEPLDLLVLGAGAAGLCAAYELERRGHRITILEAESERIGGRVLTHHFGEGLYGELGAMRIPESHDVTRHYIAEFGLHLREFVQYNPQGFYSVGGYRARVGQVRRLDSRYAYQASQSGLWGERFDEIVGGMDLLPKAFSSRLKSPVRMGCEVIALEQSARRARVTFLEQGEQKQLEADRVICTLPFPVMLQGNLAGGLSSWKRSTLRALGYGTACKVLLSAGRRFWEQEEGIYGGGSFTDFPTGMTWYPSDNAQVRDSAVSANPAVLTASYTIGYAADRFAQWPETLRVVNTIESLRQLHPSLSDPGLVIRGKSWNWDEHPWSQGAFAVERQGRRVTAAGAPDGRIHFAGEHTSFDPAWIQGALVSALRVVAEIEAT